MSKKSNHTQIKIYDYFKKPLPYSSIIDHYNQHALELFEKNENFIDKLTKKEKTRLIYHLYHHYQLELKKLFPIIGLSKTTYYYWLRRFNKPSKDAEIKAKILEIRLEHRNAGYRPMVELLKRENFYVNHKKVQRIMKELGLFSPKYKKESSQFCSYQGLVGKVSKNRLKQRFDTPIAHQKITTDMTEFVYYDRGKKNAFI